MNLRDTLDALENTHFFRLILVFWFASSFFTVFLLGRIDWIVHDQLYDYGLQFSPAWANPYWFSLRLIYVCMAIPSFLSAITLGIDFWKKLSNRKTSPAAKPRKVKLQPLRDNSMIISCPSCEKAFSKPLVMLDFTTGRPKLVNVCPYCNAKLGEKTREETEIETRVLTPDEEVKATSRRRRRSDTETKA